MARSISTFTSAIHATLPAAVRKNTVVSANIGNIGGKVDEVDDPPVEGEGMVAHSVALGSLGTLGALVRSPPPVPSKAEVPFPFCAASVRGRRFHLALLMESTAGGRAFGLVRLDR